ncbi:zinc finger matrin-type protein 2-like isoform X5 [Carassius auratus]|uniref:Zinc finger matrin-type protein 2-like isoform X5 n=1 Tax=Carassius auratus TaxID=7957 RepID=A0A6P6IWG5_CARAU|nr:zinc finger matrin-type protein 2-like isoform X5 [Carassius auratus]
MAFGSRSKNDFRRKWDKDEYEKLAQKRLRRETVKRCFSATEIIKWIWNQNWERQSSSQRPHHRLRWEGGCLLDNDRSSTMSKYYCNVCDLCSKRFHKCQIRETWECPC